MFNIPNPKNKVHPSQKPIELFKKLVLNSSQEGDLVLDPFMGAGTLPLACIETGRKYIGIDSDKSHFNVAENLINCA